MLKKIKFIIIFVLLFFISDSLLAYEYVDPKNENSVLDRYNEVFDSKQQYEDLVGAYDIEEIEIFNATSSSYWWPIGSKEVVEADGVKFATGSPETVKITSPYGYRNDPFGRGKLFHSGVDISGGSGLGNVNIIASKDGVVVYPTDKDKVNCPSGSSLSSCGGGYGNYVIIQHSDGNYTLYAHMYENSVTVKSGQSVKQGQVIGKMGSSGNSTGAHLHFEIRKGSRSKNNTVDPLSYVSAENPRVVSTGGEFLSWLNSWEGHSPIDGDYYVVENIGDGVRTVGGGVTLENNVSSFSARGIDIKDYPVGSKIAISIVDEIQMEIVARKRSSIESTLAKNSISLKETQMESLVSRMYNTGNIKGFNEAYLKYGDTDDFYNNWFFDHLMIGTKFEKGLKRRRNAEWDLFHTGKYTYN